ncbi:hypothetical protein ACG1BZ_12140 [Microbulbifer sp. CNSA002]|uniref:hypothetical protein n=1 Tax=unclassified Microbulbifer TaxID=2619833 RepID=UPI0039B43785
MPKITMLNGANTTVTPGTDNKGALHSDKSPQKTTSEFAQIRESARPNADDTFRKNFFPAPKSIDNVDSRLNFGDPKQTFIHFLQQLSVTVAENNSSSASEKIKQISMMIQMAERKIGGSG